MSETIVTARGLSRHYDVRGGFMAKPKVVKALSEATFTLSPGKTLAVVGEFGLWKIHAGAADHADRRADGGYPEHQRDRGHA